VHSVRSDVNDCPANQTRHKLGYVPGLDGVRGIAILFVIGNHIPLRSFHSLLPGGFAGVDIFFVLSGFLITTLLLEEFDNTGSISLRKFYLRRALRLGPALLGLLIVLCASSFLLYDKARAQQNCINSVIALFYISNWVRVFTHNQLGLLAHTWSLSAEEQFYLLWPIVLLTLLRLSKKRRYIVAVAAAVTLLSWLADIHYTRLLASERRSYLHLCFGLDSRACTLMVGCILAVIMSSARMTDNTKKTVQNFLVVMAPLSLACLIAFAVYENLIGRSFFYYGFPVIAVLTAALILDVLVSPRSVIKRILEMKWLIWLGSVSYGVYLWHWPIFAGMNEFGYKGWTVVLIGAPVTFLIVVVSYYAMEKPILEWKKRFSSSNESQPDKSLQPTAADPCLFNVT
jgi:peptidoglycan/LPS O-acetylase OafA/YrhL